MSIIFRNKFLKLLNQYKTIILFPILDEDIDKYDKVIRMEEFLDFADGLIEINPKIVYIFDRMGLIYTTRAKKLDFSLNVSSREVKELNNRADEDSLVYIIILLKMKNGYRILKGKSFNNAERENPRKSYRIRYIFYEETIFFTKM